MSKNVWSDEGHGGGDSGAVNGGIKEKDLVLPISNSFINYLDYNGLNVGRSRPDDRTLTLSYRYTSSNRFKADVFVSHHINSATPSANGLEVLYNPASSNGKRLAQSILDELWKTGLFKRNRGIKPKKNLAVLNGTVAPAVIVEYGFISNLEELGMIQANQKKLGEASARGVLNYFGIKPKPVITKPHWAEKHYNNLVKQGITINEKRYNDNITRGEVFALLDRILDNQ